MNKVGHRKSNGSARYSFAVKSRFTDVWKLGQLGSVTKIWRGERHEKVDDFFFCRTPCPRAVLLGSSSIEILPSKIVIQRTR